jgi:hypothetical protein
VSGTLLTGLAPLALGPVVLSRFDLWPAMLSVAALAALLADRRRVGGVLLGVWGVSTLKAIAPDGTPRIDEVAIDGTVLAFAALGLYLFLSTASTALGGRGLPLGAPLQK